MVSEAALFSPTTSAIASISCPSAACDVARSYSMSPSPLRASAHMIVATRTTVS